MTQLHYDKPDSSGDSSRCVHVCRWHDEVVAAVEADASSMSFTQSTVTPSTGRSTTPRGTSASTGEAVDWAADIGLDGAAPGHDDVDSSSRRTLRAPTYDLVRRRRRRVVCRWTCDEL